MAFQLLFNIITGGGDNMDDMNSQATMGNTSFDSLLTGIMILLIKFLIIV